MRIVGGRDTFTGVGRRAGDIKGIEALVNRVTVALEEGEFDPARVGEVFLAADAERAILEAVRPSEAIAVSRDGRWSVPSLLGLRVTPALVVSQGVTDAPAGAVDAAPDENANEREDEPGSESISVAVTVTVLKQDARPLQGAIADAVLLAVAFPAVVMVILDRRLEKRDLFGGASPRTQELSATDRRVVEVLQRRHGISVVLRRQDPFGWG